MFYILLIIITVSLLIIAFIVVKKMVKLKENLVIEKAQHNVKERQAKIKSRLLEKRLEKDLIGLKDKVVRGLFVGGQQALKRLVSFVRYLQRKFIKRGSSWLKIKRRVPLKDAAANYLLEAQVFLKQRKLDEAEEMFIKVLEKDPKNIEAYMGLGKIYVARNDLNTAEEAYRYIVKIKPKFLEGYKELAKVFETTKKWSELRDLAEEILSLGHEQVWVYGHLALAYRRLGYPEKAEEYFKQAVELEPHNEKWLDYLIETAIINKNKNLAQKAFNTLAQISNDEIKLQSYRDKIDLL